MKNISNNHTHTHEHCHEHEHEHEHSHGHGHEHKHGHEHHTHEEACEHGCGHSHHHEHGGLRHQIWLIGATAVLLLAAIAIEKCCPGLAIWQLLAIYLVPYLLAGHDTLHEAAEGIVKGDLFNEHFLMSVATLGALAIGFMPGAETEFAEAVFVMLFFQVGEMFESYAEGNSRRSIAQLMDIRPDVAHIIRDGKEGQSIADVSPESVAVGSIIEIRPGEKVPLDGIVVEGTSSLDTAALTGESVPRIADGGDTVLSGCINLTGVLRVRTIKEYSESTVAKIIRLVEDAGERKSRSEAFITRFARIYTPIVVIAALLLALLPPLLLAAFAHQPFLATFTVWLHRALIFLVVSCPCALVISVPLTFFSGIGGASRQGILVKGANFIDVLAKVDTVVFDKTGTLTQGQFAVTAVHPTPLPTHGEPHPVEERLLHLAAHVEHFSTHPIGSALRDAFPDAETDGCTVSDVEEMAGHGIRAKVTSPLSPHAVEVSVGNEKMMATAGAQWNCCEHDDGTVIHIATDGEYAGHIVVGDKVKDDSREAINQLKRLGVQRMVMLTGDRSSVAAQVAASLGIDEYHAEMLPADKAQFVDGLQPTLAFVGDGINDAPVLARADVGIAMGGLGSDAAIEAADVVIMDDHPVKVATAIAIARRTLGIARQNVGMAIGVKVAVLMLATVGMATMWMAAFADVGVTVLAVLNAMRAARKL